MEATNKENLRRVVMRTGINGFTIVELLVVISIISLLMSILLPSLNRARQSAYAVKCASNERNAGIAMSVYVADEEYYPASYLYCSTRGKPSWSMYKQNANQYQGNGYIHWSYYLFSCGQCDESAFECPAIRHYGAPRTNPGGDEDDWEEGQVDMDGRSGRNPSLEDFQAPRMAYTGNGAIIVRNKFKESYSGNYSRFNRFVKAVRVRRPSEVILTTEFNKNWKVIAVGGSTHESNFLVKSHRPITPFHALDTGSDVYSGDKWLGFRYGAPGLTYGIVAEDFVDKNEIARVPLNAVGRHHPGSYRGNINLGDAGMNKKDMGGTANFMYCDGHVERKHVLETVENAEWGRTFYGITGKNNVIRD